MEYPEDFAAILIHNGTIGQHSSQKSLRQHCNYVLKMSVNGASTTFGLALW